MRALRLTFLLSRRWSLYQKQVAHRALSPAHRGEYQVALLEEMLVGDVYEPGALRAVPASMPLREIVELFVDTKDDFFPVQDGGRFVGVFTVNDVRQFTFDREIYQLATAADVMTSPPPFVRPSDDLHRAMAVFDTVPLDELPVVADDDPDRLLGRLRRRAIGRVYSRRLADLRALQLLVH